MNDKNGVKLQPGQAVIVDGDQRGRVLSVGRKYAVVKTGPYSLDERHYVSNRIAVIPSSPRTPDD